jgi:hypothetical protein
MSLKIDTTRAFDLAGYKGSFSPSLKQVLKWGVKDARITDIRQLAYILATADIESDYSLTRWEADYVCGEWGAPYNNAPCQRALDYYASTNGKLNYYNLGVDPQGLPYFGRGLIQLTGKGNYKKYGNTIGVDLVSTPDKALDPRNSYDIAVEYMIDRGTFRKVLAGDLYGARRTIGSGGKTNEVTASYNNWVRILQDSPRTSLFPSLSGSPRTPQQIKKTAIATSVALVVVLVGVAIFVSKYKRNK